MTTQYAIVAYEQASFHAFLTSALSKRHRSAQIPGTNSMGGWVNRTAILEALERINYLLPSLRIELLLLASLARALVTINAY